MKWLSAFLASGYAIGICAAARAQQVSELPGRYPGYGPMMRGDWGWGPGYGFHPIGMIFSILGILLLATILFRMIFRGSQHDWFGHRHGGQSSSALDILEERFAKGEIDKAEFEDKRQTLTRRSRS